VIVTTVTVYFTVYHTNTVIDNYPGRRAGHMAVPPRVYLAVGETRVDGVVGDCSLHVLQ